MDQDHDKDKLLQRLHDARLYLTARYSTAHVRELSGGLDAAGMMLLQL